MAEAAYRQDPSGMVPLPLAAGPWDPSAQHGGPVGALLGDAMERFEVPEGAIDSGVSMARVTVDLLRPIPMEPVEVSVAMVRAGRRAQRLESRLEHRGALLARATGLRVQHQTMDVPEIVDEPMPPPPDAPWQLPEFLREPVRWHESSGYDEPWTNFVDGVELRVVQGSWDGLGRCVAWGRVTADLIEGEPLTPLQRAMMLADFSSGCGKSISFEDFVSPNADLTVNLHRSPVGEWIGMDCLMRAGGFGVAVAEGQLFDQHGRIGHVTQTCIVSAR